MRVGTILPGILDGSRRVRTWQRVQHARNPSSLCIGKILPGVDDCSRRVRSFERVSKSIVSGRLRVRTILSCRHDLVGRVRRRKRVHDSSVAGDLLEWQILSLGDHLGRGVCGGLGVQLPVHASGMRRRILLSIGVDLGHRVRGWSILSRWQHARADRVPAQACVVWGQ